MVQISVQPISNEFPKIGDFLYDGLRAFLYASKPMIIEEYKIPHRTSCISRNEPRFGNSSCVNCLDC